MRGRIYLLRETTSYSTCDNVPPTVDDEVAYLRNQLSDLTTEYTRLLIKHETLQRELVRCQLQVRLRHGTGSKDR